MRITKSLRIWRKYVLSMISRFAEFGDGASLDDIVNGRPKADRVLIKKAIRDLIRTRDVIRVGADPRRESPCLYELRYNACYCCEKETKALSKDDLCRDCQRGHDISFGKRSKR